MRQIFPHEVSDVTPSAVISSELRGRTTASSTGDVWVMSNMVTSLDGATALDGVSGGLGSAGDKAVFSALRGQSDVIVAGSSTAAAEQYRLPRTPTGAVAETRAARGQLETPRLCIISNSLRFDADLPFLAHEETDPSRWPIIATSGAADPELIATLEDRAMVLVAGEVSVEPKRLVELLAQQNLTTVMCEGGPTILGAFAAANVLDELNITTTFTLAGGDSRRMLHTDTVGTDYELDRLLMSDRGLFARYLRASTET